MQDIGIFDGHLVHFTVYCYILWTLGVARGNLVYFSRFGILYQEKSGNPAANLVLNSNKDIQSLIKNIVPQRHGTG
jgi:hypothetical protein